MTTDGPLLPALGVFGFGALEPVVVAALASERPLLLVGPHGTGKSFLLLRLAEAMGLEFRHYNASLLSFDDLVGFPMPDASGGIRYVPTAASIWGAEAVFLDEISRARPEVQNKLFSIIHERRVLGMPLDSLRYRWSAMSPPSEDADGDELSPYRGAERLDVALADRFAFVCTVPTWGDLSAAEQEGVLLKSSGGIAPGGAAALSNAVAEARFRMPEVRSRCAGVASTHVRAVAALLPSVGFAPSPRRAAFIYENVLAVHAASVARDPAARLEDSAFLALLNSLPCAATGAPIPAVRLLPLHRKAWGEKVQSPTRPGAGPGARRKAAGRPLERVAELARQGEAARLEFSNTVGEALSLLPAGGRHALAVTLFEAELTERLDGAVAEAWAKAFSESASAAVVPQDGPGSRGWAVEVAKEAIGAASESGGEERWIANVLCSQLESGCLPAGRAEGARAIRDSWKKTREELWEADLAVAVPAAAAAVAVTSVAARGTAR